MREQTLFISRGYVRKGFPVVGAEKMGKDVRGDRATGAKWGVGSCRAGRGMLRLLCGGSSG